MRIVQCKNNHFFDIDENGVCPVCGSGENVHSSAAKPSDKTKSKSKGFKIWKKKKDDNDETKVTADTPIDSGESTTLGSSTGIFSDPVEIFEDYSRVNENTYSEPSVTDDEKTSSFFNPGDDNLFGNAVSRSEPVINDTEKDEGTSVVADIQKEIRAISASSDGKTTGYFASKKNSSHESAVNNTANNIQPESAEPVTGWLVAVSGNHFGSSFNIYSGNNSIGRSNDNRIVLSKDSSISRINHAFIVFEPKKSMFFVRPGDSSGLIYVNDELVNNFIELKLYDTIELGESKFVFVPLCNNEFSWEKYID